MNGVLTLPGIAALILGLGMAVDANVITYERIKEEIKVGRPLSAAFKTGSSMSLTSIIDANLTTLLAAFVLFFYGTSSVKGFATMLIVSIVVSFITAVYGSRFLLGLLVKSNLFKKPFWYGVKEKEIRDLSENVEAIDLPTKFDRFDFVRVRNKFFALSGIILAAGLVSLLVFKLNLGIDFSQGTRIEVQADHQITGEEYRLQLEKIGIETDDIVISGDDNNIGVAQQKTFSARKNCRIKSFLQRGIRERAQCEHGIADGWKRTGQECADCRIAGFRGHHLVCGTAL